ncbi:MULTISPECIES: GNAT family N-acetyltransferase [unclassified Streptomyces]|uniref:GNAT family N-acetyltransferase n=1 Tax=unclassified Streptomyces TaxID=2593676 RepID=UPI00324A0240
MSTTTVAPVRAGTDGYVPRTATAADLGGARAVMLDTVYRDLRSGYVPRWHADIIDPDGAYLRPERCTLLVVECDGEIVATGAVRDRGPQAPPNPQWVADRFPSGTTAQLCRIYVAPGRRRNGLARRLVRELCDFVAATGGARSTGAGRWHLARCHLLPAVVPPVLRHAVLRVPAIALALASFGFLGLGTQAPAPEWGRMLSENMPYVERAPAAALAALGALAVLTAAAVRGRVRTRAGTA